MSQSFKIFVNIYDHNQLCIVDYKYHDKIENKIQFNKEIRIILIANKNDSEEVIPNEFEYSSCWDNNHKPDNLFKNKGYFCTKSNSNEYILFKFDKDYIFKKIYYKIILIMTKQELKK